MSRSGLPSVWKLPLAIALVVMVVTAAFANQQSASAQDRREAAFDRAVTQIEANLGATVERRINEFAVARDYVQSHDWLDPDELREFLDRRRGDRRSPIPNDLGLTVAEYVDDMDALQARERANGRDDFTAFSMFAFPVLEHIVMTHVEIDVPIGGRSLVGMDVSPLRGIVEPPNLFERGEVVVQLSRISDLLGGLTLSGQVAPSPDEYETAVLYLIAPFESRNGDSRGVVTRLESIGVMLDELRVHVPSGVAVDAVFVADDQSLATVDNRSDDTARWTRHVAVVGVDGLALDALSGLDVRVVADDGFAADLDPGTAPIWGLGCLVSAAAAVAVWTRARQTRRLFEAGIELELAQTMASTDPLTGLLNRGGLVAAVEHPDPVAGTLLFIDIDNFKAVNDTDGHAIGDLVLRRIARELRQQVRGADPICRLGGDEFLIFLIDHPASDRLNTLIATITAAIEAVDSRISCSIGSATRNHPGEHSLDDLLAEADQAMYEAKRAKPAQVRPPRS